MTEEVQIKRGPGRPRKNPAVEHEPKREAKRAKMRAAPNWETVDANLEDSVDRYRLPKWFLDKHNEYAFQWNTDSVFGQPDPHMRRQMEMGGWTPVHQEDFDGDLDGMYMQKGDQNEINLGGQVLMARPKEYQDRARKLDQSRAREQIAIKEAALRGGDLQTTLDSRHPSAVASNKISKSYERIDIPKD